MGKERQPKRLSKKYYINHDFEEWMNSVIMLLAIPSVWSIIAHHWPNAFCFVKVDWSQSNIDKINDLYYNLGLSFSSASIFYLLTIYLPNKYRKKSIQQYLRETLKLLKDHYDNGFRYSYGKNWRDDPNFPEEFFYNDIVEGSVCEFENNVSARPSIKEDTKRYLYEIVCDVENKIGLILNHADRISVPNQKSLLGILTSTSFKKIKHLYDKNTPVGLERKEWISMMKDIQNNYKILEQIEF